MLPPSNSNSSYLNKITLSNKDWFSTQDIGKITGLSSQSIRRAIEDGTLNATLQKRESASRGVYRIHVNELDSYLEKTRLINPKTYIELIKTKGISLTDRVIHSDCGSRRIR
jgi:glucan phosphorylase